MKNTLKKETLLVRAKADTSKADPVATPIYQSAAFRTGDPYFYTRNSNPNFQDVEELLCMLDGGEGAVLFSSGMGAIDSALGLLKPGDKLVVHHLIYGCSYRFLHDHCERSGIDAVFTDLSDPAKRDAALDGKTRMVFFETPTNPFLKTVGVAAVAQAAKAKSPKALIVVDNTWATPMFQNPLSLGADIAVYSCSKFFAGHSDLILGAAVASTAALAEELKKRRFYAGGVPDPFAAWLLRRSLQTLDLRLKKHSENYEKAAALLKARPEVAEIFLADVDGEQLKGYGGMLFFRFKDDPDGAKAEKFASGLELFDLGTPLATVTSAVAIPFTGSHLSMTGEEKAAIGLDKSLVRLSMGIESADDLLADLEQAIHSL